MNILIVEDEPIHARYLRRLLEKVLGNDIEAIFHEASLVQSENYLKESQIDLLFLDLNLFGENGFDLLNTVPTTNIFTIVVSGNTDQALSAFEYGVIDFIAKPVSEDRLRLALERYDSFRRIYNPKSDKKLIHNIRIKENSRLETGQYTKTRLLQVDLEDLQTRLNHLMDVKKIYLDEDLSLEVLAEQLDLHPRQLSEFLNGRMNITFNSYVHKYRINEAKKTLLEFPEKNVSDVGFHVGYKSLSSFYEAFKKETGMTASELRANEVVRCR
ncbi:response regulator transcription factor [Leptospira ilyithenensis]|uniref:AraC family transcriptional regulator n=1 Tax=Leptospira ilyithenensis TaxID=2484901 RepID=A0A4V3JX26_9LEPT|nr:response regulator transcription factor [Leptospira ilyithenensis]TGN10401.1 AraC family transcriptional regulator [Leptospira ilyithenensis]